MRLIKVKLNKVRWLIYKRQYLLKCMFHETSWIKFLLVCCTRLLIITCQYCLTGLILRLWVELLIFHTFEIIHIRAKTPLPSAVIQWQSSGNPVCLEVRPQCTLECHWRRIVGSQCVSSVLPVVFQWLSSGIPVCSNYANEHWIATGTPLGASISQCGSSCIPVYLWLQWSSSMFQLCKLTLDRHWNTTEC